MLYMLYGVTVLFSLPDISDGLENVQIPMINEIDQTRPDFIYIRENQYHEDIKVYPKLMWSKNDLCDLDQQDGTNADQPERRHREGVKRAQAIEADKQAKRNVRRDGTTRKATASSKLLRGNIITFEGSTFSIRDLSCDCEGEDACMDPTSCACIRKFCGE